MEQQGGQRTRPEAGVKNYLLSAGNIFPKTMFRVVASPVTAVAVATAENRKETVRNSPIHVSYTMKSQSNLFLMFLG